MRAWVKNGALGVLLMLTCSNVFAEVPKETVIIGDKAYSLNFANNEENVEIVKDAIRNMKDGQEILVKSNNGKWMRNDGSTIDVSRIPEVSYINENGKIQVYGKGDGEVLSEDRFNILSTSFIDGKTIEISFSQPIKEDGLSQYIKVSDNLQIKQIKLNDKNDRVLIELDEKIKDSELTAEVFVAKGIKNLEGVSILQDLTEKMIVINEKTLSNRTFDHKVCIISDDFEGYANVFHNEVILTGNNGELRNSEVSKVVLNPGKGGEYKLYELKAEELFILSGADHSIALDQCEIERLLVDSSENTRIAAKGKSIIENTEINSDAILNSQGGTFKNITVVASKEEKTVTLDGKFDNVIAQDNSSVKVAEGGQVNSLIIEGSVKIEGNFIDVNAEDSNAKIEFIGECKIEKLVVSENTEVKVNGELHVEKYEGNDEIIKIVKDAAKENKPVESNNDYYGNPQKNITKEYEVDGIKLTAKIGTKFKYFNGRKFKNVDFEIDLGETVLSNSEKLGVGIKVLDVQGNPVQVLSLGVRGNKISYKDLKIADGEGILNLVLESKGNIRFEIK